MSSAAPVWPRFLGIALFLVLVVASLLWSTYRSERYFARALAQGRTRESVVVSGTRYEVDDGAVTESGAPVGGIISWRALKLAYEVSLARRDPFFNIAGTDPEKLRAQTALLAQAEQKYASAQKNSASSTLMFSLYPISFLNALSSLEDKRQKLLADPTEGNAQDYEAALSSTANAKARDLERFEKAFSEAVPDPAFTIATYSGLLNRNNELRTISALLADTENTEKLIRARNDCLGGLYFTCADTLELPVFAIPLQGATSSPAALEKDIAALWEQSGDVTGASSTRLLLTDSSCLSALGGPYDVDAFAQPTDTGTVLELSYADNIFFTPTDIPNAPFLAYLRTQLGMHYTPDNTFKYYTCPQIGIDMGSVIALENIAAFARAHPDVAPSERAVLLQGSSRLSEYAALSYLNSALTQVENTPADGSNLHALEELTLMEKGKSGGLDEVLADMVHVGDVDTNPQLADMDTSAGTIFATHSAFPSFFRIGAEDQNVLSALYIQTSVATQKLFSNLVPYSTLRFQAPPSEIIHDLRAFLILEGRYQPSIAPSTSPARMSTASSTTP